MNELVLSDVASLDNLDRKTQELAISSMLDQSRQWLDRALEANVIVNDYNIKRRKTALPDWTWRK